jgi:putative sigma-54 modulation protein
MEVEFTARKVKISRGLRTQAAEGMERISLILGKNASAGIVFSAQKHLQIVEVTIKARMHTIAAEGKANTLQSALHQALEHAERQARRHRDRRIAIKRKPKQEKALAATPAAQTKSRAVQPVAQASKEKPARAAAKAIAVVAGHYFPAPTAVVEPHIATDGESFALRPMTIEEAVQDAWFHNRDLLIFHNLSGELFVLHRRRDGQLELVKIPQNV